MLTGGYNGSLYGNLISSNIMIAEQITSVLLDIYNVKKRRETQPGELPEPNDDSENNSQL
ncbi:MAG TPA: hypothetical protein VFC92_07100 [Bacteroidales bacterium]|nr:hypothetical protein [Bacteroidales bacterium]